MVPTWRDVLTRIPRLDSTDWQAMNLLKRWLVATRAAVFIMTLFSAVIGLLLAVPTGGFDPLNALLVCLGLLLAHATNNLINDWTDSRTGVDRNNYFRTQYGPQPLENGLLSNTQMAAYILITGGLAAFIGALLVIRTDITTLYFLLAGAFFVLFYTWPLKFIGLGELSVWVVWGPLMILGTAHVVGGDLTPAMVWIACIYGIGPTTVLMGKHTDKLDQDRVKGVHTLPVLLGEANSRRCTIALWILQPVAILAGIATGTLGIWYLLPVLALPALISAVRQFRQPRPARAPEGPAGEAWPLYLVSIAFRYNRSFSGLLFLAVALNTFLA